MGRGLQQRQEMGGGADLMAEVSAACSPREALHVGQSRRKNCLRTRDLVVKAATAYEVVPRSLSAS